ncbi:hypothetical protein D9758_008369 [Tetrapyrgos nigripes]|uniref:Aromatic compound dioxygenase n=1 Tax=Tetrapyrgos nigripes TaxID=182062 RepID=A0A8H5GE80_9AGAR|nr:hypothetical protein D9758_008369 [Tetrapyrgos nigripes]
MRFAASVICAAVLAGIASAAPLRVERRDCSAEIAAYNLARREARGTDVSKRSMYPTMPNEVCVLAPEIQRQNWVQMSSSLVRQDITEGQAGVSMILDIGVLDITTCQPIEGALVEVWHPNQVGNYGNTFLRGAFQSGSNGIVEFNTIFPGYASDGANHINLSVHVGGTMSSGVSHNGQVFFTDPWTSVVGQSAGYNANTHKRVMNNNDPNYVAANSKGYSAIVDVESIQDDWPAGVVGYITVGINPNKLV